MKKTLPQCVKICEEVGCSTEAKMKGGVKMNRSRKQWGVWVTAAALAIASGGTAWSADAKAGKANYDKLCVSCHAADGKGNPAMAKSMSGLDITTKDVQSKKDDELAKVIVEGKGKMPASGKNLTKSEQADMVAYVRTLGK
jgi:mono/diheme cytochrome c family protein